MSSLILFAPGASFASEKSLGLLSGTYALTPEFCSGSREARTLQGIPADMPFISRIRTIEYDRDLEVPFESILVNGESVCIARDGEQGSTVLMDCDHGGDSELEAIKISITSQSAIEIGPNKFHLCVSP